MFSRIVMEPICAVFLYWEWNIVYVLLYRDGAVLRCSLCMEQVSGTMHSRGELAAGASVSAGL